MANIVRKNPEQNQFNIDFDQNQGGDTDRVDMSDDDMPFQKKTSKVRVNAN